MTPRYTLPALPYGYAALEPHISAEILKLHHDKHHRAYVEGANETFEKLADVRDRGDFDHIAALEKALAFHVSGHVLHSIFWQNLSPDGGGEPDGALADAIERDFGNFAAFKEQMIHVANTIMGSGWAALVWEPVAARLAIAQIHDHQSNTAQSGIPLMVLDAWEHAYYLQYKNEKKKFFDAVWRLWNWDDIAARLAVAKDVDLYLFDAATSTTGDAPSAGQQN